MQLVLVMELRRMELLLWGKEIAAVRMFQANLAFFWQHMNLDIPLA